MIISLLLFLSALTGRICHEQLFFIFRVGEVNFELKESADDLFNILVDSDQIVFNQVTLAKVNPLFAFFFLARQLVNIVDVVVGSA